MTLYRRDQLVAMQDPYQKLVLEDDSLIESRDELEKLNHQEKMALITKMVRDCPDDKVKHLVNYNKGLFHPNQSNDCFHGLLSKAMVVRGLLDCALDQRNKRSYEILIKDKFDGSPFKQYPELTAALAKNKETSLATKLSLSTPLMKRDDLLKNCELAFKGTELCKRINDTILVIRLVEQLMLDDKASSMFSDVNYQDAILLSYPELVEQLLERQSKIVAGYLAHPTNAQDFPRIENELEKLKTIKPFNDILEQFKIEIKNVSIANISTLNQAFFNASLNKSDDEDDTVVYPSSGDDESDENDDNNEIAQASY